MIEAHLNFSKEEWARGFRTHLKASNLSMLPLLGMVILAVTSIWWFATDRWTWGVKEWFCFCMSMILGVFLMTYPRITLGIAARQTRLDPRIGRDITWKFSSDHVEAVGEGVEFKTTWKECCAVRVAPQGILLYPLRSPLSVLIHRELGHWHWIPATAFADEDVYRSARKLIHEEMRKINADSAKYQKD